MACMFAQNQVAHLDMFLLLIPLTRAGKARVKEKNIALNLQWLCSTQRQYFKVPFSVPGVDSSRCWSKHFWQHS